MSFVRNSLCAVASNRPMSSPTRQMTSDYATEIGNRKKLGLKASNKLMAQLIELIERYTLHGKTTIMR